MKSNIVVTEHKVKDVEAFPDSFYIHVDMCTVIDNVERYKLPSRLFLRDRKGEYLWLWDVFPLKIKDLANKKIIERRFYGSIVLKGAWK